MPSRQCKDSHYKDTCKTVSRSSITSHHHITPHHITSHHISTYHITSHINISHHITSHINISHHITPHHTITSHHIITPSHHISHHTTPRVSCTMTFQLDLYLQGHSAMIDFVIKLLIYGTSCRVRSTVCKVLDGLSLYYAIWHLWSLAREVVSRNDSWPRCARQKS